ncbi:hypothetical protein [Methylobrevis pamukkalensis]|uniref:Uncharacterized protein n=1 Tax=Methylobrevis pamukkalensis TaxID=1439726 RepID=A0A1E3H391_9HYPH|nr:hypothetical protein [Methylobrevis pamukkalensis]ODN70266.1 hypothetical protein A6302_02419 [Methylobrevis pamukkalensis]
MADFVIDIPTVLFLHQISFLVGLVTFAYVWRYLDAVPGAGWMMAHYACGSASAVILALWESGGAVPSTTSFALLFIGAASWAFFFLGVREISAGRSDPRFARRLLGVILPLVAVAATFAHDDAVSHRLMLCLAVTLCVLAAAGSMLASYRHEPMRARRFIATIMLLHVMVLTALAANLLAGRQMIGDGLLMAGSLQLSLLTVLLLVVFINERTSARLHLLATTDSLTGVGNRRHMVDGIGALIDDGACW